jgi:hypothetical protein
MLPATGAGTGYVVRVVAKAGSGTSPNADQVFLNGRALPDFRDVRFTGLGRRAAAALLARDVHGRLIRHLLGARDR